MLREHHHSSARPARRRAWVRFAVILLAAGAVGVFADRGALLPEPWNTLAEVGTPFVLVAFAAGRQTRRLDLGAAGGAIALTVGQAAYYAWLWLVEGVSWGGTLTHSYRAGDWLAAGAVVGALVGVLGSASRSERPPAAKGVAWGLLVAVPLAESVQMLRWQPPEAVAGVTLLMLALALAGWGVRRDLAPATLALIAVLAAAPGVLLAENLGSLI